MGKATKKEKRKKKNNQIHQFATDLYVIFHDLSGHVFYAYLYLHSFNRDSLHARLRNH